MADGDHGAVHRLGCLILCLLPAIASAQSIPPQAEQYRRDLTRIAYSVWGLEAPIATLAAQLHQESLFDPGAVSWAGASGLGQMMPPTAASLARIYPELQPVNVFDPRWSLKAQSYLMRELWQRYPAAFDCFERLGFSTASYSQGPGYTARQIAASPMPRFWFGSTEFVKVGKRESAYRETLNYSRRIMLTLRPLYMSAGWAAGKCA